MEERNYDFKAGELLLLDKPLEWTSFDVVNSIRVNIKRQLGIKKLKVGHAGTLDPLATGMLIICTGKMTKQIDLIQAEEKEYTGTFKIGATTPSFDLESEEDNSFPTDHITEELLFESIKPFIGKIEQTPPIFSAIKIDGKRAYEYARENKDVVIKSKQVEIKEFELTRIELPEVDFRVVCSKGTYIRSLARDFGETLKSGAYLTALRRTRIGSHKIEQAISIEKMREIIEHVGENYQAEE
ncbi:MAG: tRNA pseudouridine(55) synthase TruB [Bacteroidales bacterium]|nr:tRNA pseudouridine(55) synthase TruB [Bacteroidales bacterium]